MSKKPNRRSTAAPSHERNRIDVLEKVAVRAEDGSLRTAARIVDRRRSPPQVAGVSWQVQALYRIEMESALPPMQPRSCHFFDTQASCAERPELSRLCPEE